MPGYAANLMEPAATVIDRAGSIRTAFDRDGFYLFENALSGPSFHDQSAQALRNTECRISEVIQLWRI